MVCPIEHLHEHVHVTRAMNGSMGPPRESGACACVLGSVRPPLQLSSPLETAGPNTFPFCNLFLFPRLLPPLTGHSVTYALTLNSPGPSPKRLLSESGSMCSEVQTVSPLHFLSQHSLLAPFHSFLTSSVPSPFSLLSSSSLLLPTVFFGPFRSFNAKYVPYTLFNPITPFTQYNNQYAFHHEHPFRRRCPRWPCYVC